MRRTSGITPESLETGRKFNEIRLARKMTGTEFGDSIEISRASVSQIETARRNPRPSVVALLMKVHNVSPLWWDKGEGPMFRDAEDRERRDEQAATTAAELAERDERVKSEARAEVEKEKQNPEMDHLKALFARIKLVLPDSASLIEKNDVVTNILRDLREGEETGGKR